MAILPPVPLPTTDLKAWALKTANYLQMLEAIGKQPSPKVIQLERKQANAKATMDGLLMFDPSGSPVYSRNGSWKFLLGSNAASGDFVQKSGDTMTGPLALGGAAPVLEFDSSAFASPKGHYRFWSDGASFGFQEAVTANFATYANIWLIRTEQNGGTGTLNIFNQVSIGGAFPSGNAGLKLDASYPGIWFADSTPSGDYPNFLITGGNSNFRFSTADANGTLVSTFMWASPLEVNVLPNTRLASSGGTVEVGLSTGANLELMRSGNWNYISVPDAASTGLRVRNYPAGTVWASISSTAGWAAGSSDLRLKENIANIEYGLDTIMALRPIQFDWIAEKRHDIGFIAQDVEHIIPEIVEVWPADPDIEGDMATYAMRKDALVAVLVRAVQELTLRVQELEAA